MDQTLAAIYGTAQVSEEDVEKLAAAELAEKLASGEAELDDETLEALASEVLAAEAEEAPAVEEPEKTAEEAKVEEPQAEEKKVETKTEEKAEEAKVEEPAEKTAETAEELSEEQQKIAEADYLGRVMAHAFAQESREIEKSAASKDEEKEYKRLAKGHGRVGAAAGGIQGALNGGLLGAAAGAKKGGKKGAIIGALGGGAAGAAAGGGVGYAGGRVNHWLAGKVGPKRDSEKTKKSSALETLIAQRAAEICQENGVDPAVLTQEPEKQADAETVSPYDVLASKVEEGAWELLKAKGLVEEKAEEPAQE